MELDSPRAYWIDVIGLAIASVLMFRFGLLRLLFLVPMQLVWIRRGEQAALISSAVCVAGMGIASALALLRIGGLDGATLRTFVGLDLVFVIGMLAGLYVLNSPRMAFVRGDEAVEFNLAERTITVVVVGALLFGPALWLVSRGDRASGMIAAQIEVARPLFEATGATTEEVEALTQLVVRALLTGVLLGYLLLVVGNWWVGVQIAFRTRLRLPAGNAVMARLSDLTATSYVLPGSFVWVLIVAWAGVLAAINWEMGTLSFVFWNAGFASLALYAMQGIAILLHFAERRKLSRRVRRTLGFGLVLGLLIPGLQIVVALGLPGLGVSEIWVDYHRLQGSEEEHEGHT